MRKLLFCFCLLFACGSVEVTPSRLVPAFIEPSSLMPAGPTSKTTTEDYWLYIGTYTNEIHQLSFNTKTGKITPVSTTKGLINPSFLAIHPSQKYLYAVDEVRAFEPFKSGAVSAFSIEPSTGKLTLLNHQTSGGLGPCHLSIDRSGKFVFVANYESGSIEVIPIKEDGSLGEPTSFIQHTGSSVRPRRQSGPHAHSIQVDADNKFVFVTDLGTDKVMIYQFDEKTGVLTPNGSISVKAGSGPRHFAMHPNHKLAFVLNELRSTIGSYLYDSSKGTLTEVQTLSTLPKDYKGRSLTAELVVHPSGKFLYSSNRGHNSISIFSINESSGELTLLGHESTNGKNPRNFTIDPSGEYLIAANQSSGDLHVFTIDQETGLLKASGEVVKVPKPVCVELVPASY